VAANDPQDRSAQAGTLSDADIGYFQDISSQADDLWPFDGLSERESPPADEESRQSTERRSGDSINHGTSEPARTPPNTGRIEELIFSEEGDNDWVLDDLSPDEDNSSDADVVADIAWEEFAYLESPKEFEDGDAFSIPDDRLTREDRARQVAGVIAAVADWSPLEIAPLIEALAYHRCHHATRKALITLIVENGMTSDELAIVFELRRYWPTYGYSRSYRSGEAVDGWESLPWSLALRMIRQLRTETPEEAMRFIEDCFEDWSAQPFRMAISEYRSQPYFLGYLDYLLNHMHDMTERWCQAMPPEIDFQLFPVEDEILRRGSIAWRELQELGLPCQRERDIWLSFNDDKAT
jgi:hypothetical protein